MKLDISVFSSAAGLSRHSSPIDGINLACDMADIGRAIVCWNGDRTDDDDPKTYLSWGFLSEIRYHDERCTYIVFVPMLDGKLVELAYDHASTIDERYLPDILFKGKVGKFYGFQIDANGKPWVIAGNKDSEWIFVEAEKVAYIRNVRTGIAFEEVEE